MAKSKPFSALERENDPERTQALAESEGLAAKLLALEGKWDEREQSLRKQLAETRGEFARLTETVNQLSAKVDRALTEWERRSRDLENTQREAAEQVRQAGQIARKMEDRVKVLDQLRETAEDPRELLKPVRKEIAQLRQDFESNKIHADNKLGEVSQALSTMNNVRAWEHR